MGIAPGWEHSPVASASVSEHSHRRVPCFSEVPSCSSCVLCTASLKWGIRVSSNMRFWARPPLWSRSERDMHLTSFAPVVLPACPRLDCTLFLEQQPCFRADAFECHTSVAPRPCVAWGKSVGNCASHQDQGVHRKQLSHSQFWQNRHPVSKTITGAVCAVYEHERKRKILWTRKKSFNGGAAQSRSTSSLDVSPDPIPRSCRWLSSTVFIPAPNSI